jgi:hypothetical protein
MNETEITRELSAFAELVKHLATKEEVLQLRVDVQKIKSDLILWIIGTNVLIGGTIVGVMVYLNNLMMTVLTHWKP